MTPFCRKIHHIKTILLNTKMFCEWLKTFLSRIRANFSENPTINKKGTPLNQNWHFLRKLLY